MQLRMTLEEESLFGSQLKVEMSYTGGLWNRIADCSVEGFNAEINKKLHYSPSLNLPPAIRYLSPDHTIVLWERPPGYVSFQFSPFMQRDSGDLDAQARYSERIFIPWQRYVLLLSKNNTIVNLFMFFARQELHSLSADPLLIPPILNFYQKGRLCPAVYAKIPEYEHTIRGAIEAAYDSIWNSGFNYDTALAISTLKYTINNPLRRHVEDEDYVKLYKLWANSSEEQILNMWDYHAGYRSFKGLLKSEDLHYDYLGQLEDLVVNFSLAAQTAARTKKE